MFVDQVKIHVLAGHGGSGSCSFRREMFVPLGGPDGGDGGKGGNIVFVATTNERSLVNLKFQPIWKAPRGGNGEGQKKFGKCAIDCCIRVPVGTLIFDAETDEFLCDLNTDKQEFVAAKGGQGGRGNVHFKTAVNRAPRTYQLGEEGEEKELALELKTVANVGLVGFPNAGKSTLLCAVSDAKPKIASYPFTTLYPKVGLIEMEDFTRFTIADIPGLIEGAHDNVGLGHAFLRHIERCTIFCYVLDMAGTDGRDPLNDLTALRQELDLYENGLAKRPFVIVANKMDMPESEENYKRLIAQEDPKKVFPVCAELKEKTADVINGLYELLKKLPPQDEEALNRVLLKHHSVKKRSEITTTEFDEDL
ncbi:MAG: GTPase ObgE [Lentisphaeria bacterium]